jgi:hypothetical protein
MKHPGIGLMYWAASAAADVVQRSDQLAKTAELGGDIRRLTVARRTAIRGDRGGCVGRAGRG